MINALHLLWIIPLSASIGAVLLACFVLIADETTCPYDCTDCPQRWYCCSSEDKRK